MPDMPNELSASRRGELAAEALEDVFKLLGYCALPASPVLRHLAHAYWNLRYIGQNNDALRRIEAAKAAGVEWADFYEAMRLRFRREDEAALAKALAEHTGPLDPVTLHHVRMLHCRRQIELVMCMDMLPDHLVNEHREVVWNLDPPHHTFVARKLDPASAAEQAAAEQAASDDPLESP